MTCCVTTHENSNLISTDHDLSKEIHMNDVIRIRTETFRVTGVGSGNPAALRDFNATQKSQLGELIKLTQSSNMGTGDRRRVMCMITLDAHNRDLIEKLISEGVSDTNAFLYFTDGTSTTYIGLVRYAISAGCCRYSRSSTPTHVRFATSFPDVVLVLCCWTSIQQINGDIGRASLFGNCGGIQRRGYGMNTTLQYLNGDGQH